MGRATDEFARSCVRSEATLNREDYRGARMITLVIGAFFTVTFILAIAGIPAMLFGWWLRRFGSGNIDAIEAGYSDYVASAA